MKVVYLNEEYDLLLWEGESTYTPYNGSTVSINGEVWVVTTCTFNPAADTLYAYVVDKPPAERPINRSASTRPTDQMGAIINVQDRQDGLEKKARRVFAEVANLKKQIASKPREK